MWFRASQLDKTLSWAALGKRLSDPPLTAGQDPGKRRLQTKAGHQRDVVAAHDTARAERNQEADHAREPAHAQLNGTGHRWARTWADRGPATAAKASHERALVAAGITPTPGDTLDPATLAAAVGLRRQARLMAEVQQRPAPDARPFARGAANSPSVEQAPIRDRDHE